MKVLSVNERQKKSKQKIPLSPVDVLKAPNVCTLSIVVMWHIAHLCSGLFVMGFLH